MSSRRSALMIIGTLMALETCLILGQVSHSLLHQMRNLHKVLSDNCESRHNHRYAIEVQDLATQWIQYYLCKTKTSIPWNLAKLVKISPGIFFRRHHTDRKWEVRRMKEGTSAVLLQSGLDENWWTDSIECCCYLRTCPGPLADWKTPYERRLGETIQRTDHSVWFIGWVLHHFCEIPVATALVRLKSLPRYIPWKCVTFGSNLERRHIGRQTLRNWRRWTHLQSTQKDYMQRKC